MSRKASSKTNYPLPWPGTKTIWLPIIWNGTAGKSDTYEVAYPAAETYSQKTIWHLGYGGPGGAGHTLVKDTLLRHGNWDSVTNSVIWDPAIADHSLPASLYLSAKPSWWGTLPWPAIGPDLTPMAGKIPAQLRFEALNNRVPAIGSPPTASPNPVRVP